MNKFILTVSLGISLMSQSYAADEIGGPGALQYLDNLKTCTPFTYSYPHPFVHGFTGQNIIKGKEAGNCLVTWSCLTIRNSNADSRPKRSSF